MSSNFKSKDMSPSTAIQVANLVIKYEMLCNVATLIMDNFDFIEDKTGAKALEELNKLLINQIECDKITDRLIALVPNHPRNGDNKEKSLAMIAMISTQIGIIEEARK